jgi:hypothetical protein
LDWSKIKRLILYYPLKILKKKNKKTHPTSSFESIEEILRRRKDNYIDSNLKGLMKNLLKKLNISTINRKCINDREGEDKKRSSIFTGEFICLFIMEFITISHKHKCGF